VAGDHAGFRQWICPGAWSRRAVNSPRAAKRPNFFTTLLSGCAGAVSSSGAASFRATPDGRRRSPGGVELHQIQGRVCTCPLRSRASPSPMWPVWMGKADWLKSLTFLKKNLAFTRRSVPHSPKGCCWWAPARQALLLQRRWPVRPSSFFSFGLEFVELFVGAGALGCATVRAARKKRLLFLHWT